MYCRKWNRINPHIFIPELYLSSYHYTVVQEKQLLFYILFRISALLSLVDVLESKFPFWFCVGCLGFGCFKHFLVKFETKSCQAILWVKLEIFLRKRMTHLCSWKYHIWDSSINTLYGIYRTIRFKVPNAPIFLNNKSLKESVLLEVMVDPVIASFPSHCSRSTSYL